VELFAELPGLLNKLNDKRFLPVPAKIVPNKGLSLFYRAYLS